MSLFRWLSSGKKQPKTETMPSVLPTSGLSRMDSTRPVHAPHHNGTAQAANRKHERLARRELLYGVVREAMVRASVLSSSYKFKVLSLDTQGRHFLVMVDLSHEAASDTMRLAEIEAVIAQSAKARFDILVTAVYWRANEHVAVGDPLHPMPRPAVSQPAPLAPDRPLPAHASGPRTSRPAPLAPASSPAPLWASSSPAPLAPVSGPAPLAPAAGTASRPAPLAPAARSAAPSQPAPTPRRAPQVDPLHPSEVAAFKQALDVGLRGEQALAAGNGGKTHNYMLLTGFEDTELAPDEAEQLSATQYGAPR